MAPIKLLASQAHSVNTCKNLRTKVMKCCTNIYFNRQCALSLDVPQTCFNKWSDDGWLLESKHVATLIDNKLVVFWLNLLLEYSDQSCWSNIISVLVVSTYRNRGLSPPSTSIVGLKAKQSLKRSLTLRLLMSYIYICIYMALKA